MDARRLIRPAHALVLALALAEPGCRFAWNLWARGDLARDVKAVLAREGILVKSAKCHMFGTLNSGACVDYLYLFHHPTSATACIQVLYTPEGVKLPEPVLPR